MAKRAWIKVRNARKKKSGKALKILVTKAQAKTLGEFFGDTGCPFKLSAAEKLALKGTKRKAGRKK